MQTPPDHFLLSTMLFDVAILYVLTFTVLCRYSLCPAILTLVRLLAHLPGTDVIADQLSSYAI